MLECLIIIMPGVFAAFWHCRLNKAICLRNVLISALAYTAGTNLIVLSGLWIIGMRKFNLFEMSIRFKTKWLILGMLLGFLIPVMFNNVRKKSWSVYINMIKRIFPSALFLIVTYAIYTPSALFLGNIEEFMVDYIDIVPIVLLVSLILLAAVSLPVFLVSNEKVLTYYIAFIFSIASCIYIQSNFLNPVLPSLDGFKVDWNVYYRENIISTCFWVVCILIMFGISFRWQKKAERILKYLAYFVSAVQATSLVVLIILNVHEYSEEYVQEYYFSKEGEFTIGLEENIVIFVVDSLGSEAMKEYIMSEAYEEGQLDDFTFFDNTVSGGASTNVGVPLLLTGIERDPYEKSAYVPYVYEEASLYDDLHENGYDVRIFTNATSTLFRFPDGIAENFRRSINYHIGSPYIFGKQLYKLVNFYVMPQPLKDRFFLSTSQITNSIVKADTSIDASEKDDIYSCDDNLSFYIDMKEAKTLQADYKKSFRLYHIQGVHGPYNMNENLEIVEDYSISEQQQLQGVMKEIYTYIEYMKNANVYNESAIIIIGDHGQAGHGTFQEDTAALIKRPYESHKLEYSSVPICFRNVYATLASVAFKDYSTYGPSAYDITDESDVERLHTINNIVIKRNVDFWPDFQLNGDNDFYRIIIPDDLDDTSEYKIWNPREINCIDYELGEAIDYTANNSYANQVNYRLYKENGAATASNELSMCLNIKNYSGGDLQFHFSYSKVYNKEQNIRIYANGNRIETVMCSDNKRGEDHVVTIPENMMDDDTLVLRMVFPNAVTPNQIDRTDTDTRILSVAFDYMCLD